MVCSASPLVACPASEVCDYDTPGRCGAGYEPGHCIVPPGGCTTDYVPVCGCDAHTYSNDCSRKMARVQLDHTGACLGGAGGAGGSGAFNCGGVLTCDATRTYCYGYNGGVGNVNPMYSCQPSPTSCSSAPTCGCVCPASSAGCAQSPTCTCTQENGLTKLYCTGG